MIESKLLTIEESAGLSTGIITENLLNIFDAQRLYFEELYSVSLLSGSINIAINNHPFCVLHTNVGNIFASLCFNPILRFNPPMKKVKIEKISWYISNYPGRMDWNIDGLGIGYALQFLFSLSKTRPEIKELSEKGYEIER